MLPFHTNTLFVVISLFACHTLHADSPVFHPAPRLAIGAAELEQLKQSPEFAARRDQAVQAAEALLKNPAVVPDGPGDWIFYYACPDDGATLSPLSRTEHVCPRCKKTFTDERTCAAYRTQLHDAANRAAEQLGWAYAFTHDERLAAEVRRILLKLAADYPSYPKRRDRWGRSGFLAPLGGRRYSQSLDEAVGILPLAKAFDLTRNSAVWTEKDAVDVAQYFRSTSDTLLFANLGINNHQTWYNAGLMAIASVLGDEKLVDRVLTMPGGFRDQLARSVDDDGLWYEGTMAYQNYALQAMVEIVDAGRRLNLPLHREPKLRTLMLGPTKGCYPNGQYPAINDSDRLDVGTFDWSFRWAAKTLENWPGTPRPPIEPHSHNLAGAGLAVLRAGEGERAACAILDYGPHGGGHGHFDKLNLMLFANGREWLLDPGRLDYSQKEYHTWAKHTAAHNTVAIDEASQRACQGKLLWFDAQPKYSACAAQCESAYPGVVLTRYLFLCEHFLADVFTVEAKADAKIDWFAHADSRELRFRDAAQPLQPTPLGGRPGYQHLTDSTGFHAAGDVRAHFIADDEKRLGVWLVGSKDEQLVSAIGIGYTVGSRVPCLVRRKSGKQASFITVYDLSGNDSNVRKVTPVPNVPLAIEIETATGVQKLDFATRKFSQR